MDPFVSIPKPPPLHPVFVFFHAESFESGDASLYGPDKLLDKEMILVTLNYRLGILGYLSTEDEHAPGNLALHDQRMALIWVQKNIRLFGGDPTRITIGGQGAGAASVFDHLLSRWSSGFFHAAILQSGSGLCSWARERRPVTFAKKVADLVGCGRRMSINEPNHNQKTNLPASIQDKIRFLNRPQESNLINRSSKNHANEIEQEPFSSKQIVDCLRKVSASALLKAQTAFKVRFSRFKLNF